jgi:predicted nucleotidyltransferase
MGVRRALVEQHREEIIAAVHRHRGLAVALFGSAARGDDTEASDVDLLVDFEPGSALFDLMHLHDELEQLLGCRVDVVSAGGLKPRDERIRRESMPL